jgi:hypothetical protein
LSACGRAILVDWNWTRIGNGFFDVAGWLPSLHADGGPLPEAVLNRDAFQHIGTGSAPDMRLFWPAILLRKPVCRLSPECPRATVAVAAVEFGFAVGVACFAVAPTPLNEW